MSLATHVKTLLQQADEPLSLKEILDAVSTSVSFDGVKDPLHNLRGVCCRGVRDGWLRRVRPGIYALASAPRRKARPATSRGALELTVGAVTLRVPSEMRQESVDRIVRAVQDVLDEETTVPLAKQGNSHRGMNAAHKFIQSHSGLSIAEIKQLGRKAGLELTPDQIYSFKAKRRKH